MRCEVVCDDKGKLVAIRELTREIEQPKAKVPEEGSGALGQFGADPESGYRVHELDLPTGLEKTPVPELLTALSVDLRSDLPHLVRIKDRVHRAGGDGQ